MFLQKDEGGCHTAFISTYLAHLPQFYTKTANVTGRFVLPKNVTVVCPGDKVSAVIELRLPVFLEEGLFDNWISFLFLLFQLILLWPIMGI